MWDFLEEMYVFDMKNKCKTAIGTKLKAESIVIHFHHTLSLPLA